MANILILSLYLGVIFVITFIVSRNQTVKSYVLNDRKTSLLMMVLSGSATFLGAAASVFVVSEAVKGSLLTGIIMMFGFPLSFVLLGFLAPKIRAMGTKFNAMTIADFYGNRFGNKNKILMVVFQLIFFLMGIGMQVVAVSYLLSSLFGISYFSAAILLFLISATYSVIGGLKTDIVTDAIQFGFILLTFVLLALFLLANTSFSTVLEATPKEMLIPFSQKNLPLVLLMLCGILPYEIVSAHIWQRILSATDEKVAQRASFWTAGVIFLIQGLVVFLGLYAFYKLRGMATPDLALFTLISDTMPLGLGSLGLATILAITMSSLDSLFVSGSVLISHNLLGNKNKIWLARGITLLFALTTFVIALIFPSVATLGYFSVAWCLIPLATILFGIYGEKLSNQGAFWALLLPMIATLVAYPFVGFICIIASPLLSLLIILVYDRFF